MPYDVTGSLHSRKKCPSLLQLLQCDGNRCIPVLQNLSVFRFYFSEILHFR